MKNAFGATLTNWIHVAPTYWSCFPGNIFISNYKRQMTNFLDFNLINYYVYRTIKNCLYSKITYEWCFLPKGK